MKFYLHDANASDVILPAPQVHNFIQRAVSASPMLETDIVLNEKDIEKAMGKVEPRAPRGKKGGRAGKKNILFLFSKAGKCLSCFLRSIYLRSLT